MTDSDRAENDSERSLQGDAQGSASRRRRRVWFGAVLALLVALVTLTGGEAAARLARGFSFCRVALYQRGLASGNLWFKARDWCKVWNRRFVQQYAPAFRDWPAPLRTFEAPTASPRYLFRPDCGVRCGFLFGPRAARPGERTGWSTNSWGFRGPEFQIEKPPGMFRIVCVGASTTEGEGVCDDDETYPFYLEQALRRRFPDSSIQVINAGHHGYMLEDIVALLEWPEKPGVRLLEPDLVIFYALTNNVNFREWTARECLDIPRRPVMDWLNSHSALCREAIALGDLDRPVPRQHPFVVPTGGLERFRQSLRRVPKACRQAGADVLMLSYCTVVHEGLTFRRHRYPYLAGSLHRQWYPLSYGEIETIFDAYNGIVREVARDEGAHFFNVAARFPKDLRYFWDAVHFTPEGNRLLARHACDYLCGEVVEAGPDGLRMRERKP